MRIAMFLCLCLLSALAGPGSLRADAAGQKALLSVIQAVAGLSDFELSFEAQGGAAAKTTGIRDGKFKFHRAGEAVDLSIAGRLDGKQGSLSLAAAKLGEKLYLSMNPPKGTQAQPMAFFVDLAKMGGGQKKAPALTPKQMENRARLWMASKKGDVTVAGNRITIRKLDEGKANRPDQVEILFDGRSHLPLELTAYKDEAVQGSITFSGWKTRGRVSVTPALSTAAYRPFDMRMLGGILGPLAGAMGKGSPGGAGGNPFAGLGAMPGAAPGQGGQNPFAGLGAMPGAAPGQGGKNPFAALMERARQRKAAGGQPANPFGGLLGKPGAAGAGNPFLEMMKKARERQAAGGQTANPLGGLLGKPGAAGAGNPFLEMMKKAREQQGSGKAPANPLGSLLGGGGAGKAMQDPKFQKGMKKFQEGLLQMQQRLMEMQNQSGSGGSSATP